VAPPAPSGFDDARLIDAAVDDDDHGKQAERSIVAERSKDRRGELKPSTTSSLNSPLARAGADRLSGMPCWTVCARHDLRPGEGQLLVFTEFTDTATWLKGLFANAGFSVDC